MEGTCHVQRLQDILLCEFGSIRSCVAFLIKIQVSMYSWALNACSCCFSKKLTPPYRTIYFQTYKSSISKFQVLTERKPSLKDNHRKNVWVIKNKPPKKTIFWMYSPANAHCPCTAYRCYHSFWNWALSPVYLWWIGINRMLSKGMSLGNNAQLLIINVKNKK